MRFPRAAALITLALVAGLPMAARAADGPAIITADIDLFYRVYDSAGGKPSGAALQRDYIDAGTPGVREFVPQRILSGERLAARIAADPKVYEDARRCVSALPAVKVLLKRVFQRLKAIYPQARFPPVTVLVGRNTSGGTSGPSGVLIGLEVVCATVRPGQTVEDRFVHLIAHEYGHVEQAEETADPTVLRAALTEGVAELVGELTSGEILNTQLVDWTRGREREIGEAFLRDADGKDLSAWLYNGVGTREKPGDLAYWVGWRIARRYYDQAPDKRAALRELLALEDPSKILRDSGWRPGD